MNLQQLREKRAQVLRDAEAFKQADGTFKDEQTRAAFDAKMTEIDGLDVQIRTAEAAATSVTETPEQIRAAAATAERVRINGITDAVRLAKLPAAFGADLVQRGVSLDGARTAIFTELERQSAENPTRSHVDVVPGQDARDKWMRGMSNWLLVRSGYAALVAKHDNVEVRTIDPGEFRGLTLIDIAKEGLARAGKSVRGLDRMNIAGQAMAYRDAGNYQTTSDFATLLENVMHKILQAAYAVTPDTWSKFCAIASVTDFRTHNWYRTGALSVLDDINQAGEFTNKAVPDGEKATYSVGTKGNIVGITRETIVNDDLGAMTRLIEMLGRSGKLTIEKAVYALLGQNSGDGPTMADTYALFHTSQHGANKTTGAALSADAIDADRVAMAKQQDVNSQEYLDLRPAILLLNVGLGGKARIINQSQFNPDRTANAKSTEPNVVVGLFREVVDTPRITANSGTRRYLFADPSVAPVFLVSFLEGQQSPVLETQDGWRFNGVEMKARLDVGVNVVDYRGAVSNAGQ